MVCTSYSQNSMTEKTCKEEENGGRKESKTQLLKYKLIKTGKTPNSGNPSEAMAQKAVRGQGLH